MIRPSTKTNRFEIRLIKPSNTMLDPMAQITCNRKEWNLILNVIPSVMIVTSISMSQRPLVIRKRLASFFDRFNEARYADTPDRNTNNGAQKWVTHLVK